MPDQKVINKLINTYENYQSPAHRYDEQACTPAPPRLRIVSFPKPDATFVHVSGSLILGSTPHPLFRVVEQMPGDRYFWQVINGTVDGPNPFPSTPEIFVSLVDVGTLTITCTLTRGDSSDTKSQDFTIIAD